MKYLKISNLPPRSSSASIKDGLFHELKKYGNINSVVVRDDYSSRHDSGDRYAIASFHSSSECKMALEMTHKMNFLGVRIKVELVSSSFVNTLEEFAMLPKNSAHGYSAHGLDILDAMKDAPKYSRTLLVLNLPNGVHAADLKRKFGKFGNIVDIDVKAHHHTGSPAFAFLQFVSIESVTKAKAKMDGTSMSDMRMRCQIGRSVLHKCVFLDDLPDSLLSRAKLTDLFQSDKIIVDQVFVDKRTGQALVWFARPDMAKRMLRDMQTGLIVAKGALGVERIRADYASEKLIEFVTNPPVNGAEEVLVSREGSHDKASRRHRKEETVVRKSHSRELEPRPPRRGSSERETAARRPREKRRSSEDSPTYEPRVKIIKKKPKPEDLEPLGGEKSRIEELERARRQLLDKLKRQKAKQLVIKMENDAHDIDSKTPEADSKTPRSDEESPRKARYKILKREDSRAGDKLKPTKLKYSQLKESGATGSTTPPPPLPPMDLIKTEAPQVSPAAMSPGGHPVLTAAEKEKMAGLPPKQRAKFLAGLSAGRQTPGGSSTPGIEDLKKESPVQAAPKPPAAPKPRSPETTRRKVFDMLQSREKWSKNDYDVLKDDLKNIRKHLATIKRPERVEVERPIGDVFLQFNSHYQPGEIFRSYGIDLPGKEDLKRRRDEHAAKGRNYSIGRLKQNVNLPPPAKEEKIQSPVLDEMHAVIEWLQHGSKTMPETRTLPRALQSIQAYSVILSDIERTATKRKPDMRPGAYHQPTPASPPPPTTPNKLFLWEEAILEKLKLTRKQLLKEIEEQWKLPRSDTMLQDIANGNYFASLASPLSQMRFRDAIIAKFGVRTVTPEQEIEILRRTREDKEKAEALKQIKEQFARNQLDKHMVRPGMVGAGMMNPPEDRDRILVKREESSVPSSEGSVLVKAEPMEISTETPAKVGLENGDTGDRAVKQLLPLLKITQPVTPLRTRVNVKTENCNVVNQMTSPSVSSAQFHVNEPSIGPALPVGNLTMAQQLQVATAAHDNIVMNGHASQITPVAIGQTSQQFSVVSAPSMDESLQTLAASLDQGDAMDTSMQSDTEEKMRRSSGETSQMTINPTPQLIQQLASQPPQPSVSDHLPQPQHAQPGSTVPPVVPRRSSFDNHHEQTPPQTQQQASAQVHAAAIHPQATATISKPSIPAQPVSLAQPQPTATPPLPQIPIDHPPQVAQPPVDPRMQPHPHHDPRLATSLGHPVDPRVQVPQQQQPTHQQAVVAPVQPAVPAPPVLHAEVHYNNGIHAQHQQQLQIQQMQMAQPVNPVLVRHPVIWEGSISLKVKPTTIQMHYVAGSKQTCHQVLGSPEAPKVSRLKIMQRMRLRTPQLNETQIKIQTDGDLCTMCAVPCGIDENDRNVQSGVLQTNFIDYLTAKCAAGVVTTQSAVIHVYAKSEFTNQVLQRHAPDLYNSLGAWPLLLIIVDNKTTQAAPRPPQIQPATPLHQQGPLVTQPAQ